MFNVNFQNEIHIQSSWQSKKQNKTIYIQTNNILSTENTTQSYLFASSSVQTDLEIKDIENKNFKKILINDSELLKFLDYASKIAIREIKISLLFSEKISNILIKNLNLDIQNEKVLQTHTFNSNYIEKYNHQDLNLKLTLSLEITRVGWNCNQNVLIISYGEKEHYGWCNHNSAIVFWNLHDQDPPKKEPDVVIPLKNCIVNFVSHPSRSSELAVGNKLGEIFIINKRDFTQNKINEENYIKHHSTAIHKSDIVFLTYKSNSNNYLNFDFDTYFCNELLSCSLDGIIVHWKIDFNKKQLQVINVFAIYLFDFPKSFKVDKTNLYKLAGIRTCSISKTNQDSFIIGCDGGALFSCLLSSDNIINLPKRSEQLNLGFQIKSPIVLTYVPHRSHVYYVEHCNFDNKIFASCGIENELRIYNCLDPKPIIVIHQESSIFSLNWSHTLPFLFGVDKEKRLFLYKFNDFYLATKYNKYIVFDINEINSNFYVNRDDEIAVVTSLNQVIIFNVKNYTQSLLN